MEGDNLQVNRNPIKDCKLVAAPSSSVVRVCGQFKPETTSLVQFHFTAQLLNMCLLQAEASRCKQVNKTGKV